MYIRFITQFIDEKGQNRTGLFQAMGFIRDHPLTDDKDEATARRRVSVYNNETMPVAEHYAQQGKYAAISGIGTIDDIFELVCQKIQQA
ncbi:MAG: hypothetical protein EOO88_04060 [Pedobacter sp.]|nr:MAG: hypothetical protein EOO88_04060 [Pedobacter sp.]